MRRAHRFHSTSVHSLGAATLLTLVAATLAGCEFKSPEEMQTLPPTVALASEPAPSTTVEETGVVEPSFVVPENVSYETAETAFVEGRYDEARAMFEVYSNNRPENPWGHYMLGLSSWKAGDHQGAVAAFEESLSLDGKHVKSMLNLARVLLELDRAEEALVRIDSAAVLDSTSSDVHRLRGRAYGELGRIDESIESYRRAIALDEKDAWAMNNLGFILIQAGRFEEAIGPLALATELRGDVPIFRNNLGVALERTGHFTQATESFRKAVELDSTYTKASVSLSRVQGRTDSTDTVPVDLTEAARRFVEEVRGVVR